MRFFTRMTVCAATAVVLSAVLFHLADAWFGDNSSVLAVGRQIVFQARRSEALLARAEMVMQSLDIKRHVISDLIAGRLSYRSAIVQFQKANELVEIGDLDLIAAYQSPTDLEGVGRQVFLWARNTVAIRPSNKSQRFLAGLEREFETMFNGAKLGIEYRVRPMDSDSSGRIEANSGVW